ncbi:MAG TPA: phage holin family protein [Candidatus Limnocylindria bacterium]|nr:phage holin family protein [Candidatus Limnocylindria bacterium]
MDRIIQVLINAGALYVAVLVVPGMDFDFTPENAWLRFLLVALVFALVNTFIRPVLQILTFPITIVTLGLFLIVINALMLLITDAISDELALGLTVADFFAALLGALVISIVGFLLSLVIGTGRKLV